MKYLLSIAVITVIMLLMTYLFGFIYMFVVGLNNKYIQRNFGRMGYIVFACIGTPFHELSHFIMAKLFGHKVTKAVFFQPREAFHGGTPGYIRHSYNQKSLYQRAGCLPISIAPMVFGALAIYLTIHLCYPETFISVMDALERGTDMRGIILQSLQALGTLLHPPHFREWKFYVVLLVTVFIGTHMSMSDTDMENTWFGIAALLQFVVITAAVLPLLPGITMQMVYTAMVSILVHYLYLLSVVLVIDLAMALFFILLAAIRRKI